MKFDVVYRGRPLRLDITSDGDRYRIDHDGRAIEFRCVRAPGDILSIMIGNRSHTARVQSSATGYYVQLQDLAYEYEVLEGGGLDERGRPSTAGPHRIVAPMPGKVVSVLRSVGDRIIEGDGVVVIEAMKMQNELRSPRAGTVKELRVAPGEAVEAGAVVAVIDCGS
jgi:biotin carboxyl carrier protein